MEVKCIKFKFENTTYIIKDLEIDSRSLNTKSIVAKLFTEDYILNEIAPNGTLRVINSDILKNKISQFGKTDFKDVISVIEDDSVLYKDIADNLIGNASLNSLSSLMRIHGSKSHESINTLTKLLKNTKLFSGNDNFIKISKSDNSHIDIFMSEKRNVIHIPYKMLSNQYEIYKALSYLIVDANIRIPSSNIHKLLNGHLEKFLKTNYSKNDKLLEIQNDLLKLNNESQLKTFLYHVQSNFTDSSTNFDKDSILKELSDEITLMFDAQNVNNYSSLDVDVRSKAIINSFPDIFSSEIDINSTKYSVKQIIDLSDSLYSVTSKIKNFDELVKLGSTGTSKNIIINELLLKLREKNSNIQNLTTIQYKEILTNFIVDKTQKDKNLFINLNHYDLLSIIENISIIDNILSDKNVTNDDYLSGKWKGSMNDFISIVNESITNSDEAVVSDDNFKFIPKANVKLNANLITQQRNIIKFISSGTLSMKSVNHIKIKFDSDGEKSRLEPKSKTLIINKDDLNDESFWINPDKLGTDKSRFQKLLGETLINSIKDNRTLFEFTLRGNKERGDKNVIEQSLNDLGILIDRIKNSNAIYINDFVIQSFTPSFSEGLVNLLVDKDLGINVTLDSSENSLEKNESNIKSVKKLFIKTKGLESSIIYEPLNDSVYYNNISTVLKSNLKARLILNKNGYANKYINGNPLTLRGKYGNTYNKINIEKTEDTPLTFEPVYTVQAFDMEHMFNNEGLILQKGNTKFIILKLGDKYVIKSEKESKETIEIPSDLKKYTIIGKAEPLDVGVYYTDFGVFKDGKKLSEHLSLELLNLRFVKMTSQIKNFWRELGYSDDSSTKKDFIKNNFDSVSSHINNIIYTVKAQINSNDLVNKIELAPDNYSPEHSLNLIIKNLNSKGIKINVDSSENLKSLLADLTDADFNIDTKNAFIYKGEIFINSDFIKANPQSLFHELAHLIIGTMKASEEGYAQFDAYMKLVKENIPTELYNKYKESYKGLTNNDLFEEITAEMLGGYFMGRVLKIKNLEEAFESTDLTNILINILEGDSDIADSESVHSLIAKGMFDMLMEVGGNASNKFIANDETVSNELEIQRKIINYKKDMVNKNELIEEC